MRWTPDIEPKKKAGLDLMQYCPVTHSILKDSCERKKQSGRKIPSRKEEHGTDDAQQVTQVNNMVYVSL